MVDTLFFLWTLLTNALLAYYLFSGRKTAQNPISPYFIRLFLVLLFLIGTRFLFNGPATVFLDILCTAGVIFLLAHRQAVPPKNAFFWLAFLLFIFVTSDYIANQLFSWVVVVKHVALSQGYIWAFSLGLNLLFRIFFVSSLKFLVFQKYKQQLPIRLSLIVSLTTIPALSFIVLFLTIMKSKELGFVSLFIVLVVILMNICVLHLYLALSNYFETIAQNAIHTHRLETEVHFFRHMKESQAKIRSVYHDLKNQYLVLLGLLKEESTEEAKRYLKKSMTNLQGEEHFYTHNYVLNYLLNEKCACATKIGVDMKIHVLLPEELRIDSAILAVVIGNLLDNSLHATARLPEEKERVIHVTMKQFGRNMKIEISNTFDPVEIQTRQHRKIEGLGLKNIKEMVVKNNGIYAHTIQENYFTTNIILLNIQKETKAE